MEIRVPCTHCGKVLLVKDDSAVREGICPNCHQKVVITRPGAHDTPNKSADTPPTAGALRRPRTTPGIVAPRSGNSTDGAVDTKSTARSDSFAGSSRTVFDSSNTDNQDDATPIALEHSTAGSIPVDPLTEVADAVWFVRSPGGGQYGPASNQTMRIWIHEGRVGTQSMVWRAGWADWLPAGRVFDSMLDSPPIRTGSAGRSTSKAAEYLEKKRRGQSFVPTLWILIGLALIALIAFFIIIF